MQVEFVAESAQPAPGSAVAVFAFDGGVLAPAGRRD
jgi:hypothetical protein